MHDTERDIQAPILVFDDADPIAAANGAAFAAFVASGQTCVSGTRLLVQAGIYKEFMLHFLHKVQSIRIRMGDRTYHSRMSTSLPAEIMIQP